MESFDIVKKMTETVQNKMTQPTLKLYQVYLIARNRPKFGSTRFSYFKKFGPVRFG